jgi:uncharacterized protein YodC (DUF2158 family)
MSIFNRSILVGFAMALGIAFDFSSAITPAFAEPVSMPSGSIASLHTGDFVRVRSGGPLMIVNDIQGDKANCSWTDWLGDLKSQSFPIAELQGPIVVGPSTIENDLQDK